MKLYNIALRNLKRNRKRSILSISATAIATYAIVFMFSFINGLEDDMRKIAYNYNTGEILVRHKEFDDKSFSLARSIDRYEDVLQIIERRYPELEVSPRIKFPSTVFDSEDIDKSYTSFGVAVDFDTEVTFLQLEDKIIEGRMPTDSREVIMGHGLAKEIGLSVGDKFTPITMTKLGASTGITFTISALAQFEDGGFSNKTFIVSLEELPKMLRMEGAVSDILIKGVGDAHIDSALEILNRDLHEAGFTTIEAYSWKDVGIGYSYLQMAGFAYTIIGFFLFFLASSVIANTMLMVVFERKKEIGTITAMGMTSREVVRLFFLEALILGVVGAAAGVFVGTVFVLPLGYFGMDLSGFTGGVEMGSSFYIFPRLSIRSTLVVFTYSVFVASFVSFFPSRGASKVDPVVALRSE